MSITSRHHYALKTFKFLNKNFHCGAQYLNTPIKWTNSEMMYVESCDPNEKFSKKKSGISKQKNRFKLNKNKT